MQRFGQLNEQIDYITKGDTLEERSRRIREVSGQDASFKSFMQMASLETHKMCGLPEGLPDTIKREKDVPTGISDTNARQNVRRFQKFMINGPMQLIRPMKREIVWVQMLEGLHWQEADILTMIKDQTLLSAYPGLAEALPAIAVVPSPSLIPVVKAEKPPKEKKVKSPKREQV